MAEKEWRQIARLPDYEISEFGEIRRIRDGKTRKAKKPPKGTVSGGYLKYKLMRPDGTKTYTTAHQLVCETFCGPRPSKKHQVAHWDGNGLNNYFGNLRWATSKENHADRVRHGRSPTGTKNIKAKLTPGMVVQIRCQFTGKHGEIAALARQYGLSHSGMMSVVHRKNWLHVR